MRMKQRSWKEMWKELWWQVFSLLNLVLLSAVAVAAFSRGEPRGHHIFPPRGGGGLAGGKPISSPIDLFNNGPICHHCDVYGPHNVAIIPS